MNTPYISVVIPTRHRDESLKICLECLAPGVQSFPFDRYEVIVTDDGIDTTAESMIETQFPWVLWVQGPRRGPAANRNKGASLSNSAWLVFTDDDCLPQGNWLEMLSRNMGSSETGAIEGAILPTGRPTTEFTECPVNEHGGCFWTANVAVRRDLFQSINGFDETYPIAAHEDQDLYIRLKELTNVKFERNAVVLHPIRDIVVSKYLRSLPLRARAYAIHLANHRKSCTLTHLLIESVMFHLRVVVQCVRQQKLKKLIVATVAALVMVPLTLHYYNRFRSSQPRC
jgi:glycosyltransferase involved in cell wall biosynthesis